MFGPEIYVTIGDEYDKKTASAANRFRGPPMKVPSTKRGFVPDALFSKDVRSLSQGDKYVDPGYFDKRYRLENEKRKLVSTGFKYSNPSHKSTSPGDYYGTFSEKNPPLHQVEFAVAKPGEISERAKAAPKNFYTNPGKKGTFGFPGLGIGTAPNVPYVSDPYDAGKRAQALAEKSGTRAVAGQPFVAACKGSDFFDPKVHSIDKPLPARKASAPEEKVPVGRPFVPAGRLVSVITAPPKYMEDPYELKEKKAREERNRHKATLPWKPLGGSKSLPVRPIKFTPA